MAGCRAMQPRGPSTGWPGLSGQSSPSLFLTGGEGDAESDEYVLASCVRDRGSEKSFWVSAVWAPPTHCLGPEPSPWFCPGQEVGPEAWG